MSNNLHLIKGDVEIFENAIKAAHGDEKRQKRICLKLLSNSPELSLDTYLIKKVAKAISIT